ncbi:MAG TPA: TolC family protein [Gemmatimonadaceae bacterium]|nr:TolC family protein [Gemmatimonadaceae bacterium]
MRAAESREPRANGRDARPDREPRADALDFWRSLGDTTLQRLLAQALGANHDVEVARARASGARAARLGAALELTPSVTAGGGWSRQRIASSTFPGAVGAFPDQEFWDAGLRASWEVDVFGRLRRSLRGQGELASAADEDRRDVQVLVAAQVASAYFDLRGAQDRLAVARRNAENQRGTLEVTKQRLEAGRGTALDSERAQAQLSATLAVIPTLEARIAAAQYRIGVLSGRPPAEVAGELSHGATVVALPEAPVISRPDSVALRRPDVRSAERRMAASSAFVGAAKADYLPRFALGATAGYTGATFDSFGNTGTRRYTFGPVVSWPALDIGRVRAGVDAARASEAEAKARYEQTVLRSTEELETSLVAYRKALERLKHLEDAAAASERAAELARLRYVEGASDFLQVLDAERTLLERQDAFSAGRTEAAAGLVAVYRALGGGR